MAGRRLYILHQVRIGKFHPNVTALGNIVRRVADLVGNSNSFNAQVLQWEAPIGIGKDVAIIKIPASDLPTVQIGNSETVRVQDPIMVIGYPGVASNWGNNDLISDTSNFIASTTNGHSPP